MTAVSLSSGNIAKMTPRARWIATSLRLKLRLGLIHAPRMSKGISPGTRFYPGASNRDYSDGSNEQVVQEALRAHLPPGGIFFDVGANVGYFATLIARAAPASRVFAFEPIPANVAASQLNLELNRLENVQVFELAVGDHSAATTLLEAHYSGGSALESAGRPPDFKSARQVHMVSLDDCVAAGVLPMPQLVKIDVEGAEVQVLKGMTNILKLSRPTLIYELDGPDEKGIREKKAQCRDLLHMCDYECVELEDSYPDIRWHVSHTLATPKGSPMQA
jgi:FkbM family methyltransferase